MKKEYLKILDVLNRKYLKKNARALRKDKIQNTTACFSQEQYVKGKDTEKLKSKIIKYDVDTNQNIKIL